MKKLSFLLTLVMFLCLLCACADEQAAEPEEAPAVTIEDFIHEKEVAETADSFPWESFELLHNAIWTDPGYFWYKDGTLVNTEYTADYQSTTEKFPIAPNTSYVARNFTGVITLYDESGANGTALEGHWNPNEDFTFETGAEHRYIGVSHKCDGTYTTDRVSITGTIMSSEEYHAMSKNLSASKPLSGKKVVCFGDSLFGLYYGDTSAPAHIYCMTGATVYNVAFGGCRMAVHPTEGYGAFSMWALARAIAKNDWTEQELQAPSGSSYFQERVELLKSIDFNTVDIAVIHYGTNDFAGGYGVPIDNEDHPEDYTTLCGALRYSIEKLLGAYPRLKIYISLPVYRYWTDEDGTVTYAEDYQNSLGYTLSDYVEALREVAIEYDLPVIDGYYGLGINSKNAATFLEDGVHHNALGRQRFGHFIGAHLSTH